MFWKFDSEKKQRTTSSRISVYQGNTLTGKKQNKTKMEITSWRKFHHSEMWNVKIENGAINIS